MKYLSTIQQFVVFSCLKQIICGPVELRRESKPEDMHLSNVQCCH